MAQEGMLPMRNKPSGAADERATTTADQDDRDQAAVLREVLFIYPEVLTLDELARQMVFASDAFGQRDRIERAVRDLTRAGLLHQVGPLVLPTRTAVVFARLVEL
jgi:hypothetical protein